MSTTIDNIIDDVRDVVRILEPALSVIAIAQAATGLGGTTAERAIATIKAALKSFEQVAAGDITRDQAMASLAALRAGLAANDAAADSALDAKFKAGE